MGSLSYELFSLASVEVALLSLANDIISNNTQLPMKKKRVMQGSHTFVRPVQ